MNGDFSDWLFGFVVLSYIVVIKFHFILKELCWAFGWASLKYFCSRFTLLLCQKNLKRLRYFYASSMRVDRYFKAASSCCIFHWTICLMMVISHAFQPTAVTLTVAKYQSENEYQFQRKSNSISFFDKSASLRCTMFKAQKRSNDAENEDDSDEFSLDNFQKMKNKRSDSQANATAIAVVEDEPFSGYDFRDIIFAKWGKCYDVEFNRVETFGMKKLYLNVLPFSLERKPFRHQSELAYLCHLQAVVEILVQYDQLEYALEQIGETTKRPIPNRSPLIAVPIRLNLTDEQIYKILG